MEGMRIIILRRERQSQGMQEVVIKVIAQATEEDMVVDMEEDMVKDLLSQDMEEVMEEDMDMEEDTV